MTRRLWLAVVLVLTAGQAMQAAEKEAPKTGDKIEVQGKLNTHVVAVGGETTGIIVDTKGGNGVWELDLKGDKELLALAKTLDGKQVAVSGKVMLRKGLEVGMRRIIVVDKLAADESK